MVLEMNSPTLPAAALSLVVVPTMPPVVGLNVMLLVVNAGNVVLQEGIPPLSVTNTLLFAVVISPTTFADDEYKMRLTLVVAGHVAVDQAGVVLEPDCSIWRAVAVPERMPNALDVL